MELFAPAERILEMWVDHGFEPPDTPVMALHRGRIDLLETQITTEGAKRTRSDLRSRLFSVRRLVAFLLVQALAVSTSTASSLHVHEYLGHDHPDHHHGPAAHDHDHPATADRDHHRDPGDEDHPAWEPHPCEPGRHAVRVSMACAGIPHAQVDLAELPGPTIAVPSAPVRSAVQFTDVRVHGPPFDARIPARAPPFPLHA